MTDLIDLCRRRKQYESVIPIEVKNEVPREQYLQRLTKLEIRNIAHLFDSLDILFKGSLGFMALAVGTTTFNEQYWEGLREYLQKHDPSKLGYVDRRGEDIDIILCNDGIWEPASGTFSEWIDFARRDLSRAGINYEFEDGARDSGTSYLTVPSEYRLQEGQGVIRSKVRNYSDSLRISFSNSRDIHLSFDHMIGEIKIKEERINDNPFSLLFRHSDRYGLIDLITKRN